MYMHKYKCVFLRICICMCMYMEYVCVCLWTGRCMLCMLMHVTIYKYIYKWKSEHACVCVCKSEREQRSTKKNVSYWLICLQLFDLITASVHRLQIIKWRRFSLYFIQQFITFACQPFFVLSFPPLSLSVTLSFMLSIMLPLSLSFSFTLSFILPSNFYSSSPSIVSSLTLSLSFDLTFCQQLSFSLSLTHTLYNIVSPSSSLLPTLSSTPPTNSPPLFPLPLTYCLFFSTNLSLFSTFCLFSWFGPKTLTQGNQQSLRRLVSLNTQHRMDIIQAFLFLPISWEHFANQRIPFCLPHVSPIKAIQFTKVYLLISRIKQKQKHFS